MYHALNDPRTIRHPMSWGDQHAPRITRAARAVVGDIESTSVSERNVTIWTPCWMITATPGDVRGEPRVRLSIMETAHGLGRRAHYEWTIARLDEASIKKKLAELWEGRE